MKKIKIKINEIFNDEVFQILPDLTLNEKKVLGYAIVYSGMKFEGKKCDGHFYRSNKDYIGDTGLCNDSFHRSLKNLIEKGLMKRRVGSYQKEGITASEYIIPSELTKLNPYKQIESEEFEEFSLKSPISENPHKMGKADLIIKNKELILNNEYDNNKELRKNNEEKILDKTELKLEEKTDNNIKIDSIENMEKDEDIKKPTNLKELQDFFRFKIIKKTKDCVTVEDLLKLKGDMEEELEKYEFIPSYSNCLFSIKNYFNRKVEEFQFNQLSS